MVLFQLQYFQLSMSDCNLASEWVGVGENLLWGGGFLCPLSHSNQLGSVQFTKYGFGLVGCNKITTCKCADQLGSIGFTHHMLNFPTTESFQIIVVC